MAKILIITSRFPFPLEKGDKLRIYNQIVDLGKKHEVYLIALDQQKIGSDRLSRLAPHCKSISVHVIPLYKRLLNLCGCLFIRRPLQVQYFYARVVHRMIDAEIEHIQPDAIYSHLIRTSEYVKDLPIRKTIDYMDCFSRGIELRINKTTNPFMKLALRFEYKRLLRYEAQVFDKFDQHVIISEQDREYLPHMQRQKVEIVANGVDFAIFHPMEETKKYELLFTGNMGYPPNIDAAFYAATTVLPLLVQRYPEIQLLIAGVNPPERIKRLQGKNVQVIAHFDHIRLAFAQSKINLVPIVTNIGLQNKILQAMAMKIPTVTNFAGMQGIGGNAEILAVGNTPSEMAAQISSLLDHPDEAEQLAISAYRYVRSHFTWQIHNDKLQQIILK